MRIEFPYTQYGSVDIPEANLLGVYGLPATAPLPDLSAQVSRVLNCPIGTPPLRELAHGKANVLIIADDISRPTPVHRILPPILNALHDAGIEDARIEFMLALGTHRPMTREEFGKKLGPEIVARFSVHNHDWQDPKACVFMGTTAEGADVWVNKKVSQADLVIGIGRIMPIDVCGFTGGGKIVIPGVCGRITNSQMHWTRVHVPDDEVIGRRDNPVRHSIDSLARKAGLDFIVNVIMNDRHDIVDVVAGDLVDAHRVGCDKARRVHEVRVPSRADIVIADGYPFDIEFWQVNKALDSAGRVVSDGGMVIMVSPCYEGLSRAHPEIAEFGYRKVSEIIELVESGRIRNRVVGVHMIQVSRVAMEKATVILVTDGIGKEGVEGVGLDYAPTVAMALAAAFERLGPDARVAVLRNAAEMLPVVGGPLSATDREECNG